MRLVDTVRIAAEPSVVWAWVSNPARLPRWNPKVVAVDGPDRSARAGERFNVVFRMGGREREATVEVVECLAVEKLVLRYHVSDDSRPTITSVVYELEPLGSGGTRLRQSVDLRESGLPALVRPVVWLVHNIGVPVTRSPLEQLASLIRREHAG